jgi:hypothetical protein
MSIPKIIHFIAPKDRSRWHPIWERCYPSWSKHFLDFEIKLWNDEEDITNFIYEKYPQHYNMFMEFPLHIMKLDFVRFCILHYYGGIYADMDVFCYKNFYDELNNSNYILHAPYGQPYMNGDNLIENALMISMKHSNFFSYCIEQCKEKYCGSIKKYRKKLCFPLNQFEQILVGNTAGPALVNNCYNTYRDNDVEILNGLIYNNHGMSYHPEYRTKHLLTGMWGTESFEYHDDLNLDYLNEVKQYANLNEIKNIDEFDFYKDYTNGGMKTTIEMNN